MGGMPQGSVVKLCFSLFSPVKILFTILSLFVQPYCHLETIWTFFSAECLNILNWVFFQFFKRCRFYNCKQSSPDNPMLNAIQCIHQTLTILKAKQQYIWSLWLQELQDTLQVSSRSTKSRSSLKVLPVRCPSLFILFFYALRRLQFQPQRPNLHVLCRDVCLQRTSWVAFLHYCSLRSVKQHTS